MLTLLLNNSIRITDNQGGQYEGRYNNFVDWISSGRIITKRQLEKQNQQNSLRWQRKHQKLHLQ